MTICLSESFRLMRTDDLGLPPAGMNCLMTKGTSRFMDVQISVREAGKAARRQRILDAAEFLIRKTGSTDFSMRDLAAQAGLSYYTTYNLIGSKATVLYILLNKSMDRVDLVGKLPGASGDHLSDILAAGDAAVTLFTSDPDFYRPLYSYVFGVPDPVHRPAIMKRAFIFWHSVVGPLAASGALPPRMTQVDLARNMQILFTGSMEFWIQGEMDSDGFRAHVQHGLSFSLMCLPNPDFRKRLLDRIVEVQPVISSTVHALGWVQPEGN